MPPDPLTLFGRFGAALAIGLLVGLQREYAGRRDAETLFAGVRTFALIGLTGALGAHLAVVFGSAVVFATVLLLMGTFVIVGYFAGVQRGDIGLTTEVAALVTFLAGALCALGALALAAAVGVTVTVLLALKPEVHRLAQTLSREDVVATLKFAAITALVLPVLPNETYGPPPFDVVSPYTVWLMVVFISGISFLGYVLIKVVGPRRGVGLTGVLGGLASSTAVTLTFAERSQDHAHLARPLALGVVTAWAIMFARVLVEAGVVNPPLLRVVWLPVTAGGVAGLAYGAFLYLRQRPEQPEESTSFTNPFELKTALQFGLLYGVILVVARAAQLYFGDAGIYVSAVASGLADVDAITLSMAELSRGDQALALDTAALAIVLATMSNTVVKGGIVVALGSPAMRRVIVPGLVLILGAMLGTALLL